MAQTSILIVLHLSSVSVSFFLLPDLAFLIASHEIEIDEIARGVEIVTCRKGERLGKNRAREEKGLNDSGEDMPS